MPYIIFALQLSEGGGVGSWTTFAVGTMGFVIFILSLQRPKKDITRSDTVLLITSFVSIGLWLLLDNPIASATLLIAIGAAAYIPTIRKTYLQPDSETLSTYTINTFRHGLSAFALESYNFVTLINPVIWVVINAIVVGIIVARKKQ